jgi:hypothetical protein
MRLRLSKSVLAIVGSSLLLAGCGSGSGSESSIGNDSSSQKVAAPITKATFIKQADAICAKADSVQRQAVEAHSKSRTSEAEEEELLRKFGLPPIQAEAEELGDLEAPAGDQAKVNLIVKGIKAAVVKAEADPASVLTSTGPFAGVEKLAGEYGFKVCNSPA